MLTQDQYWITEEIRQEALNNQIIYHYNLSLEEGDSAELDFIYYTLENYPRLLLKINMMEKHQEFAIHSYYYLLNQKEYYIKNGLRRSEAVEIAEQDLLEIYTVYNEEQIILD